ncbi:DUF1552 domain-containing protein [Prosthecobacter sp.]|uniref:DUF1552 domain-containing protein n=1 Tax=Prosthecobacter sp. TaxID=1965333 RepID=UPI003782FE31
MKPTSSSPMASGVSRRTFLRAAGVSIALPFFESLAGAKAATASPKRMVAICTGLGMHPQSFFPKDFGAGCALSPVLQPLAALRDDFTVISHMDHPGIYTKHGGTKSILSGVDPTHSAAGQNTSVDQVAARHVGYQTRFPSVHISLGSAESPSWTPSGIKVREETSPFDLFEKLFVDGSAAEKKAIKAKLDQERSVLDLVREQAKRLGQNINAPDRQKLEEYLTAIREAEERIQGIRRWEDAPRPKVDFDDDVHAHSGFDYATLSPLMFDLLFLAIQTDTSRVFTAGWGAHNHVIELDGVSTGYHTLSHHGQLPERVRQLQIIETFYVAQMARFVEKLKSARTEHGTLLSDTMVFFGSGLSDASVHSNRDLPIILAGGGFKHGVHVDAMRKTGSQTPLNNLFTTMLQNFGVEIDRFNGATGTFTAFQA